MLNNIIKTRYSIFWVIIFVVIFNYLSFNFFIKSFFSLENKVNDKTLISLIANIDNNFNSVKISTNDYSQWDESYEFINDRNELYIYENFRGSTTIENLNLNFMIFINSKNQKVYSQITEDLNIKNEDEFVKNITNALNENDSTIIKYEENYYYITKSKIKKSDLTGEFRGYIYSGRIFDLKTFDDSYENDIKIIESNPIKTDATFNSKFIDKIEVYFDYKNDIFSNIISLKDNKQTLLTLKFDNYREIYKEGKKQILLFNAIVSIFILILFFIFYRNLNQHKKQNRRLEENIKDEIKKQKAQEEILIHQSRSAEIGEMINNIAHQWRQPLNNLSLIIQNIGFTYDNDGLTKETLQETIDKSKIIINSMSNTIDTFRNFFEPTKDKNLFKIAHSIDNTLVILSSTLKFHNIELIKEITNDVEIYDYENEFSQVLLNIITNAKDALVSNKIEKPIIKINISKVENNLIVKIKDNANGINEKIIANVFEPYFTTKGKGNGTGIGLYMSKLIIEKNMNGKLEVENDEKGAIFKITLPLSKE